MSSFKKSVLTLFTGSAVAQIIPLAAAPIISRIYTPSEFGNFSSLIAVVGVLAVIASLRYEQAIPLPESRLNALNILVMCIFLSIISGVVINILGFLISIWIGDYISNKFLLDNFWLIALCVSLLGIQQAFITWCIREKEFKTTAMSQVGRSFSLIGSQISLGLLKGGAISLAISQIIAQSVGILVFFKKSYKDLTTIIPAINIKKIYQLGIEYKKFPIYLSWSALLNSLSVNIPMILLLFFYSPIYAGYYAFASKILITPISMIGNSIAQPFFQRATEKVKTGQLGQFSFLIYSNLLKCGLVPIILFGIVAPEIFTFVFGEEWTTSGYYTQYIVVWLLLVFISSPLSHIYTVLQLQKESLIFNLNLFISRLAILIISGIYFSIDTTIIIFGITGAVFWSYQLVWLLKRTGIKRRETIKEFLRYILLSAIYSLPLILTKYYYNQDHHLLIFGVFLILLLIYFLYIIKDRLIRKGSNL